MTGDQWYKGQRDLDDEARTRSEGQLTEEKAIFAEAMALLRTVIASVLKERRVEDDETKAKVALVHQGFNLLWSSWDCCLTGRNDACLSHWRSISEIPDFLKAIQIDGQLAAAWGNEQLTHRQSLRTIRKALDGEAKGAGRSWETENRPVIKSVQRLAHVTPVAAGWALPAAGAEGEARILVRPGGGIVSERRLRMSAMFLASAALDLLNAACFALQDSKAVDQLWETQARRTVEQGKAGLTRHARAVGLKVDDETE